MDRVAVFIDAGYLFAQGSALITGQKRPRGELLLDAGKTITALEALAKNVSGLPLLRVYWYDGTSFGPTAQHLALAHQDNVKVRLGFINKAGAQKGVDSLIITDMIDLARNGGMTDAVLLSGDEDLRVGVQQAQEFGVRVHLLGIKPCRGSQSLFLMQEADTTHEWVEADINALLTYIPRPTAPAPTAGVTTVPAPAPAPVPAPAPASGILSGDPAYAPAALDLAGQVEKDALRPLLETFKATGHLPREYDGRLLGRAGKLLGGQLDSAQKRDLRARFVSACEKRLAIEA